MTIKNLMKWIDADIPRSKVEVDLACCAVGGVEEYKFNIYTEVNKFAIYAKESDDGGYLGCVSQSRKQRPGEDWFRGNDLPDGKLKKETWDKILKAIVRYELKEVVKNDARKNIADKAQAENLTNY